MRQRKKQNAGLEPNLYRHPRKGFRYRDPITKAWEYWNIPLAEAQKRARERNKRLPSKRQDAVSRVISDYLEYLESESGNAASTLAIKRDILGFYSRAWHSYSLKSVTRAALLKHWRSIGPWGWAKHRNIWTDLYRWAISNGMVEVNEAELALAPKSKALARKRQRHTEAGYASIYAAADEWLQIAMDLAVASLQDRSTICRANRVDVSGGRWLLTRIKTGANLAIKIPPGSRLEAAVRRAMAYPVAGPTLLRRAPERGRRTAVTPDYLTKAFAEAREASGAYKDLAPEQQPSFHDLRAYGSWMYERAGFPVEYVQALMAHGSARMTQHYQDGHEVRYSEVDAGL
jgi:integrase